MNPLKPIVLILIALALTLRPLPAAVVEDGDMKAIAIYGSLLSYIYAYTQKDIINCQDQRKLYFETGSGDGLRDVSLGYSDKRCLREKPDSYFGLVINPTLQFSHWMASTRRDSSYAQSLFEVALIPKLQWLFPLGNLVVDLSFGIGPAFISQSKIGERSKSTKFQFSDEVGLGLGTVGQTWRLGYVHRHVSNAGISLPNNAVDFHSLSLSLRW